MYRRIHIMGASGAGTTTLGKALAARLPHVHLDSDDYFWEQKYTKQSVVAERLNKLQADMARNEPWILSGAVCGWGDPLRDTFDLVIFLWIPEEIRLQRLRARSMNVTEMRVCRAETSMRMLRVSLTGQRSTIRAEWRSAAGCCMRSGWPD